MGASAPEPVVCDAGELADDAVAVDCLARLQLLLRRGGRELRLRNASAELVELIDFMGLRETLPLEATSRAAAAGRRAETPGRCRGRT
jgi:hypothetical protein